MAIRELNQTELDTVAGGLTLGFGLGGLTLDLGAILGNTKMALNGLIDSGLQATVNSVIDGLQAKVEGVLVLVPALPTITVPLLGLTIGLSITR